MWKFAIVRPVVPTVWLIQKGTNLTQKEVIALEKLGFTFDYLCKKNGQSWFVS
jgi:hypothetical protein